MSDRAGHRRRVRLDGAQAVVTGAGSPVGRAVAVALAGAGSDVVCIDADAAAASTTAASCADRGVAARAEVTDLGDPEAADALATRLAPELRRLDVLVNVGDSGPAGRLAAVGLDGWAAGRSRGLDAVVHACQRLAPSSADDHRPHVVNVVSATALRAGPEHAVSAATGAGVAALTLALRADRRPRAGVSLVVAGRTATAITTSPGERRARPPRGGQAPEAVAAAVLRAVRSDRAVVLAGRDARRAWRRRRLVPAVAARLGARASTLRRATGSALRLPVGAR